MTTRPRPGSRNSPPVEDRWLIAVRMVSEGVDIPRLAVGVWATSYRTPLFFAQAVGRFVRARRGRDGDGLPAGRPAAADHGRRPRVRARPRAGRSEAAADDGLERCRRRCCETERGERHEWEAARSGGAVRARALRRPGDARRRNGRGRPEDEEFLGIPGLLLPSRPRQLLKQREPRSRQEARGPQAGRPKAPSRRRPGSPAVRGAAPGDQPAGRPDRPHRAAARRCMRGCAGTSPVRRRRRPQPNCCMPAAMICSASSAPADACVPAYRIPRAPRVPPAGTAATPAA